jgi:hypothetical protein
MMHRRNWMTLIAVAATAWIAAPACGDDDTDVTDVTEVRDIVDEGMSCPTGQTLCGGSCVNLQTNASHCGECDNTCPTTELCVAGECKLDCPTPGPYADCGATTCTSLMGDPDHCGTCGHACASGEVCSCGLCVSACHDFNTDADHCGACGAACPGTQVCCCGLCADECTGECHVVPYDDQLECGGGCIDGRSDRLSCDTCGNACPISQVCGDRICTTESCYPGQTYCDGYCVDLLSHSMNCGRCGNGCNPETEYCFEGVCRLG